MTATTESGERSVIWAKETQSLRSESVINIFHVV